MRKKLSILSLVTMMILTMMPFSAFAGTKTVTETTTGCIAINNAVNNDEFAAYKVIDIAYDAATNNLTHAFNADFADYFRNLNPAVTIEDMANLANESEDLNDLLSGLPEYIKTKNITPVKTGIVVNGTVEFTDLAMGEYLIIPTSTTSVYQLMLQKLEPQVDNKVYVLTDIDVTAKKKEVGITKEADKKSVTKNEAVTYTIKADIPNYLLSAKNKTFKIVDTLEEGLTLQQGTVEVKFSDGTPVATNMYDIDKTDRGFEFTVSNAQYNNTWQAKAAGNIQLVITYKATLDDAATSDDVIAAFDTKENNKADYTYVTYPFTTDAAEKTKSAEVDVNSFIIKIDKYAKGDTSKKLDGATFSLYRTLRAGETTPTEDIPATGIITKEQGILLEEGLTTNENGEIQFQKYEANGDNYDYYLVETRAPSGYNLLQNAIQVNFTDEDVSTTQGIYTVQVENSTGLQLPITGDVGTFLMSLAGLTLMGGAVVLLLINRRKRSAENN